MIKRLCCILMMLLAAMAVMTGPAAATPEDWKQTQIALEWTGADGKTSSVQAAPMDEMEYGFWACVPEEALERMTIRLSHPEHDYFYLPDSGTVLEHVAAAGNAPDDAVFLLIQAMEADRLEAYRLYVSTTAETPQKAEEPDNTETPEAAVTPEVTPEVTGDGEPEATETLTEAPTPTPEPTEEPTPVITPGPLFVAAEEMGEGELINRYGRTSRNDVRLRGGMSTGSRMLAELEKGTAVYLIRNVKNEAGEMWTEVTAKGEMGYILSKYVEVYAGQEDSDAYAARLTSPVGPYTWEELEQLHATPEPTPEPTPAPTAEATERPTPQGPVFIPAGEMPEGELINRYGRTSLNEVRYREAPAVSSRLIAELDKGTAVYLIRNVKNEAGEVWTEVNARGTLGYILTKYLEVYAEQAGSDAYAARFDHPVIPYTWESLEQAHETPEPTPEPAADVTPEPTPEFTEKPTDSEGTAKERSAIAGWRADSPALASLVAFVESVTDEGSPDYVPPEERIVLFDSDGTLVGERYPTYTDQCMLVHRLLHDESADPNPEDAAFAAELEGAMLAGDPLPESPRSTAQMAAESFKGWTEAQYRSYVREYLKQRVPGFDGMTYGNRWFAPMVNLVRYLAEHDFLVYICSGTERLLLREMAAEPLGKWIPPYRVIGSTFSLTATGQGDKAPRSYTLAPEDEVLLEGNMVFKNLKMNKVVSIVNEIGLPPVMVFGNSSGDFAMGQYALQHGGRAWMLLCDDTERDYGDIAEAEAFAEECAKLGFETVSMRDEFETIYGEGIVKTGPEAQETLEPAA